ncbi:hypothetical protein [Geminocystis sp. NIES-3709]|uniref:hypothetical protein n=1 Tax=Geminocystis sp. NIES-3709 TaxID=1617448 RepID=UPI0005FC3F17|nr:hypothetical protein [Geminocystis sp. NIES-3709]BAQ64008.1 hypothetical protein GM3709_773 [Geminocystis sp. NIES-3709]
MNKKNISRLIISFCLFSLLLISSCSPQPPSRFEQAQQESNNAGNKNIAVDKDAVKGASFNKFFPISSGEYERVFTQEKSGFVQAKLKRNGQDLAVLAIFDTMSNPSAKEDFKNSTDKINGFPVVEKGTNNTAVLVADRYQVSIKSSSTDFDLEQRKDWLSKFDLSNLAKLN